MGGTSAITQTVEDQIHAALPGLASLVRVAGHNRYETAALLSSQTNDPGVPVVYVADGNGFPDALSAGAAAAQNDGALLLADGGSLPASTIAEIQRLTPGRLVFVGGFGGDDSFASLVQQVFDLGFSGITHRGADRFETAAIVAMNEFPQWPDTVVVANGTNFPDALTGVTVAAAHHAPILLVTSDSIPGATASYLTSPPLPWIDILGGTAAISSAVEQQLQQL